MYTGTILSVFIVLSDCQQRKRRATTFAPEARTLHPPTLQPQSDRTRWGLKIPGKRTCELPRWLDSFLFSWKENFTLPAGIGWLFLTGTHASCSGWHTLSRPYINKPTDSVFQQRVLRALDQKEELKHRLGAPERLGRLGWIPGQYCVVPAWSWSCTTE